MASCGLPAPSLERDVPLRPITFLAEVRRRLDNATRNQILHVVLPAYNKTARSTLNPARTSSVSSFLDLAISAANVFRNQTFVSTISEHNAAHGRQATARCTRRLQEVILRKHLELALRISLLIPQHSAPMVPASASASTRLVVRALLGSFENIADVGDWNQDARHSRPRRHRRHRPCCRWRWTRTINEPDHRTSGQILLRPTACRKPLQLRGPPPIPRRAHLLPHRSRTTIPHQQERNAALEHRPS